MTFKWGKKRMKSRVRDKVATEWQLKNAYQHVLYAFYIKLYIQYPGRMDRLPKAPILVRLTMSGTGIKSKLNEK